MGKLANLGRSAALLLLVGAGGCSGLPDGYSLDRLAEPPVYGMLPSEKALDKGKAYYRDGDYGLAEQSFRLAVEEDHKNAEAWLGLAASYDRLRRFDHAERAYDVVVKLIGHTPTVLNNLGYHYLLAGNRDKARQTLAAAHDADPKNPYVVNNMSLVDSRELSEGAPVENGYRTASGAKE
jgi:Flp pilus assembly protein TadD